LGVRIVMMDVLSLGVDRHSRIIHVESFYVMGENVYTALKY
jgi:hypothetical protein